MRLFDNILKENEPEICDFNREQMYEEGIMNVKTLKKEKYSPATIRAKRNAPFNKTEHITLKWMGKFHESLKLLIFRDKFIITSSNEVWGNYLEQQDRFARSLGLTEKNKSELREMVKDALIIKIKRLL